MKSIKFTEMIVIDKPAEAVFDYTQDYTTRLNWDTFLTKADLLDGAPTAAKGVKAYCQAKNGLGMVTEYITFNRPKATAIQMTKGPYMFSAFLGSWTFKTLNPQKTEVIFLYSFTLRFPFNIVNILVKRILQRNVKMRLNDLRTCMENN
jgi:ribosome-associated toxin RatA of RatAB toxin-antitoxin module